MTEVLEQGATRRLRFDQFGPGPDKDNKRNRRKHPLPGEYRPNPKGPKKPSRKDRIIKPGQPGYKPRNPRVPLASAKASPFVRVPASVRFGRKSPLVTLAVRRLPRIRFPWLTLLETGAEVLEPMFTARAWMQPNPGNGWVKCWGDCQSVTPNHSSTTASCNNPALYNCLSGQALGAVNGMPAPTDAATKHTLSFGRFVTAGWRHTLHSMYTRPAAVPQALPLMVPSLVMTFPISPMPDPNLARHNVTAPDLQVGYASALQKTVLTGDDLISRLDALPWYKTTVYAESPPIGATANPAASAPAPVVTPPRVGGKVHVRRKPDRKTRERKVKGAIYYAFLIADAISEGSEVVGALFEALPKEVQKRWKCDRKAAFIDSAGQYGIDNADCKAKALWHNFHQLDIVEGIRNIIANQLEDKMIGALHKRLPRNMINAAEDGQKAYGEIVGKVLQELKLQDGNGFDFI